MKGFAIFMVLVLVAFIGFIVLAFVADRNGWFADDAVVASRNLSKAADNFEITRRIVFLNGITDTYLLSIEGQCSIEDQMHQLEVTCQTAEDDFRKHFLGLSDNVTYFAEQVEGADVSTYHYRVTFKPQVILPDIDFRGDVDALLENSSEINQ